MNSREVPPFLHISTILNYRTICVAFALFFALIALGCSAHKVAPSSIEDLITPTQLFEHVNHVRSLRVVDEDDDKVTFEVTYLYDGKPKGLVLSLRALRDGEDVNCEGRMYLREGEKSGRMTVSRTLFAPLEVETNQLVAKLYPGDGPKGTRRASFEQFFPYKKRWRSKYYEQLNSLDPT